MAEVRVELEDDPVPIVRVIGANFRRSLHNQQFVEAAKAIDGCFALASTKDPQAVTIRITDGVIRLTHGVAADIRLIIRLDFDADDAKLTIEGLWRHPILAIRVGKLLEDLPVNWVDAAKRLWEASHHLPRMPRAISIHCTDEDRDIVLGDAEPDVIIHGTARRLNEVFNGGAVFLQSMMEGKISADCSMQHAATLSEVTKNLLLGREADGTG
jgi:hypothetical protein